MGARDPSGGRWTEIDRALDAVLDAEPDRRPAILARLQQRDPELHRVVVQMLEAGEGEHELLDRNAAAVAANAFEEAEGEFGPVAVGARLGTYRLVERVGGGGMGEVWRAVRDDQELRQTVAVKVLRPIAAGREGLIRFQAERQILASLGHPHIAQVVDAGTTADGLPYLVLEYVEGRPLTDHCRDLDLEQRLALFDQVLEAVAFAHRHLVIHRDLKPSNILVTAEDRVKLLDFGIAKLLDPATVEVEAAPMTRTGLRLMTPEYAAPEQLRGRPVSTATDVWALGVLLHELLTGQRPYELGGRSPTEIEQLVCETSLRRPSSVAIEASGRPSSWHRELRGDLDTIVLQALRQEPEERYASVDDLARDLERFRQGRPVEARPSTIGYRARKFVRRHRVAAAAAVVVAATAMAGLVGVLWQAREARLQAERAEAVGSFLFSLFESADPEANPGAPVTALDLLDAGYERVDEAEVEPETRAEMLRVLGTLYGKLGQSERSETLLRRATAETRSATGGRSAETGDALTRLGSRLVLDGDPKEAETVLREALEIQMARGADGEDIADTTTALALALKNQGQAEEAESLCRRAIELRRETGGDDAPAIESELHNLANLYLDQERWEEAEAIMRDVIAVRTRVLGPDHVDVAAMKWDLAVLRGRVGDDAESEALHQEVMRIRQAVYPLGHPSIARSHSQLALAAQNRGRFDDAERMYQLALAQWEDLYGRQHPHLGNILANIATLRYRTGRFDEAAEVSRQALDIWRAVFGAGDHRAVATGVNNLGVIERERGDYAEAARLIEEAVAMRERMYGDSHSEVALGLKTLGGVRLFQGRRREALELFARSVEIYAERLSADHPLVAHARVDLAVALLEDGRPDEALPLLEQAMAILDTRLVARDIGRGQLETWLGVALTRLGRDAEAAPHLDAAWQILAEVADSETEFTRRARAELERLRGRR